MKYLLITLLFIVSSCTPYKYLAQHHDEICSKCIDEYIKKLPSKDSTKTTRDTMYIDVSENLHDTTYIYLKCDSLGNVLMLTVKKLGDAKNIISSYTLKNNKLTVVNSKLNDSIMVLNTIIEKFKNTPQVIEKPIVKKEIPVIVWICAGFIGLLLVIFLILLIKK